MTGITLFSIQYNDYKYMYTCNTHVYIIREATCEKLVESVSNCESVSSKVMWPNES